MLKTKKISSRVEELYRDYYYEKALDRYYFLEGYARSFVSQLDLPSGSRFYVCDYKLRALVHSYFLDVIRFKEYHFEPVESTLRGTERDKAIHESKMVSLSKVAAFTAKWVTKYCPITIIPSDDGSVGDEHVRILTSANAMFALQVAIKTLGLKVTEINPTMFANALYHLRFRTVDDRSFFLFFDALSHGSGRLSPGPENESISAASMLVPQTRGAVEIGKTPLSTLKVFVASPGDCESLRHSAEQVINNLNQICETAMEPGRLRFLPYFWENDKRPGVSHRIQDDIFQEASNKFGSPTCDVFVVSVWHRFGEHTGEEFEYYVEQMGVKKVLFCRYAKEIPVDTDGESLARLNKWVDEKQEILSPLGNVRNAISDERQYEEALRTSLMIFHEEDRKSALGI